jgi:DNA-binding beta-propeller fold protein YncE
MAIGLSPVSASAQKINPVIATITIGQGPFVMAADPSRDLVYVSSTSNNGQIYAIDTAKNTVSFSLSVN